MIPSAFLVRWPMTTLRTAQILSNIHFLMSNTKRFRKAEDITIQELKTFADFNKQHSTSIRPKSFLD